VIAGVAYGMLCMVVGFVVIIAIIQLSFT